MDRGGVERGGKRKKEEERVKGGGHRGEGGE